LATRVHIDRAARIVLAGGVVAYPTEAVYGLGCLPRHRDAVRRLLALKRRSWRKGLLLIAADLDQIEPYVVLPPEPRRSEILATWPGPVTWVLAARPPLLPWITGGRDSIAVRVTDHPLARALCTRIGEPIVSTSANVTRRPPFRRALPLRRALRGSVDYVLNGDVGGAQAPTTIKDGRSGRVLRPG
jgi:L-threonylcarbamoyladenylate synthase